MLLLFTTQLGNFKPDPRKLLICLKALWFEMNLPILNGYVNENHRDYGLLMHAGEMFKNLSFRENQFILSAKIF